jgi:hypothetical protein
MTKPYRGVLPIAPTPFKENGDLDLDGMRRVLDCLHLSRWLRGRVKWTFNIRWTCAVRVVP